MFRDLRQHCKAPALIEWDNDVPALSVLLEQAHRAEREQCPAGQHNSEDKR